jgi:hypothetical protein
MSDASGGVASEWREALAGLYAVGGVRIGGIGGAGFAGRCGDGLGLSHLVA